MKVFHQCTFFRLPNYRAYVHCTVCAYEWLRSFMPGSYGTCQPAAYVTVLKVRSTKTCYIHRLNIRK